MQRRKATKVKTALMDIKHMSSAFNSNINCRKGKSPLVQMAPQVHTNGKDPKRNKSNVSASSFTFFFLLF